MTIDPGRRPTSPFHPLHVAISARRRRLWPMTLAVMVIGYFALGASGDLPEFDIRNADPDVRSEIAQFAGHTRALRQRAVNALQQVHPDLRVSANGPWETATAVRSTARLLTDPADGPFDVEEIVRSYLDDHADILGVTGAALQATRRTRDAITRHNGVQTVWWQQQVDGVDLDGCALRASVTERGQLVTIGSTMLKAPVGGFDLSERRLSMAEGVVAAAATFGVGLDAAALVSEAADGSGRMRFERVPGFKREPRARLVYFPLTQRRIEPAYKVILTPAGDVATYELWISAVDGALLRRENLTSEGGTESVTYRVWTDDSPTPLTPGLATPDGTQPPVVARDLLTLVADDPVASPQGWIPDGQNVTAGNNVLVYSDLEGDGFPDFPILTGSSYRVFDYPVDLAMEPSTYVNAAITHAFFVTNRFHDAMYALGFTEEFGNFQADNFGRGGVDGDNMVIEVQDGAESNGAFYSGSGDDGVFGIVTLGVFDGPTPGRDAALDSQVLVHELTHGLSTRLHGGLFKNQPRGMGEGWSDYFALAFFAEPTDDPHANYPVGGFVAFDVVGSGFMDNHYFGVRRYPYTTDLTKNPLTFADIDGLQFDVDPSIPTTDIIPHESPAEVHNVGEVWCSALWECRAALIEKYGFAGNEIMLQLVIDGMKLTPNSFPDMTEGRDMILLADQINNGGANVCDLWNAFAKRGLGFSAVSPGVTTNNIVEAFDIPDELGIFAAAPLPATAPFAQESVVTIDVVERVCGEPMTPGTATMWLSVNDGPYQPVAMTEESPLKFSATLPALGCGEFAKYYFTADTASESFSFPVNAPLEFHSYPVVTPQTARLAQIAPADLEASDQFGYRVAVYGDRMAVTNWEDDAEGQDAGSVYVYRREGESWVIETELFASDPSNPYKFGNEIDMDADRIVAAAWDDDEFGDAVTGPVYVFKRDGQSWSLEQRIVPPDPEGGRFGWALAIDGARLLIGARALSGGASNEGAVFYYEFDGSMWTLQQEIRSPNPAFEEHFGAGIDLEGDIAVIGELSVSNFVLFDHGSVYEYAFDGSQWVNVTEIAPTNALTAEFGQSVDLNGDFLAVGGPKDGEGSSGGGAAWVFRRDGMGGWIEEGKLEPEVYEPDSSFAEQVAMGNGVVAVGGRLHDQFGSSTGVVAIYRRIGGQWFREQTLAPGDPGFGNGFGSDVQILGNRGFFGAYRQNAPLNNSGSVFEYEMTGFDCDMNGVIDGCEIQAGAAVDSDGDGIIDSCETPELLGDLNGDGVVNGADLASLLAQWGTGGSADLNMDGVVNGADLATLLANWT